MRNDNDKFETQAVDKKSSSNIWQILKETTVPLKGKLTVCV